MTQELADLDSQIAGRMPLTDSGAALFAGSLDEFVTLAPAASTSPSSPAITVTLLAWSEAIGLVGRVTRPRRDLEGARASAGA